MLPFIFRYNHKSISDEEDLDKHQKNIIKTDDYEAENNIYSNQDIRIELSVKKYHDTGVKDNFVKVTNISGDDIEIEYMDTVNIKLIDGPYEIMYFKSGWGSEFTPVKSKNEIFDLENRYGRSSREFHPMVFLKGADDIMTYLNVAWSGNWHIKSDRVSDDLYVSAGLSDYELSKILKSGEGFEGAHVFTYVSGDGDIDTIGNRMIEWGRKYYFPQNEISRNLSVEWNHWWPYEDKDINEEVFKKNVDAAAQMGFEACTLDAGWFGPDGRDTEWYEMRGDWDLVNRYRFPSGIRSLSDYVHEKGLKFGLWCEIEALGEKAALRLSHPDFEALYDGKRLGYICFGNPDVQKWAYDTLDRIITEYNCDWIKLDFNLDPGAGCNRTDHGHQKGDGLYEHYKGYYETIDKLRAKYPEVLFENCSSGGQRIDLGIMHHLYNAYLSDPDMSNHNLGLYWSAMLTLAPNNCLHWPWSMTRYSDNHEPYPPLDLADTKLEQHELDFHIRIAMLGWFGMSHKLCELPQNVVKRIIWHIAFYKNYVKEFILKGYVYRLTRYIDRDLSGEKWSAFQYVMNRKNDSIVFVFRLSGGESKRRIKLKGLSDEKNYKIKFIDKNIEIHKSGIYLMTEGISFDSLPEQGSEILLIE